MMSILKNCFFLFLFCLLFNDAKAQVYYNQIQFFSFDYQIVSENNLKVDTLGQYNRIRAFLSYALKDFVTFEHKQGASRIQFKLIVNSKGKVKRIKFDYPVTSFLEGEIRRLLFEKMPKWEITQIKSDTSFAEIAFSLDAKLNLDRKDYFYENGVKQFDNGEYKKALKNFTYSIEHYPYYTDAYYNRAASFLKLNDTLKACPDWRIAADLDDLESKHLFEKYCTKK